MKKGRGSRSCLVEEQARVVLGQVGVGQVVDNGHIPSWVGDEVDVVAVVCEGGERLCGLKACRSWRLCSNGASCGGSSADFSREE